MGIVGVVVVAVAWTDKTLALATACLAFFTLLLFAGVLVALNQLNESRRDRHIQVISDFGRRWDSARMAKALGLQRTIPGDEAAKRVAAWLNDTTKHPEAATLLMVLNFFEDLAIVVEEGELDIELVSRTMGAIVLTQWKYWEETILYMQQGRATNYSRFTQMAKELVAYEARQKRLREQAAIRERRRSVFRDS